MNHIRICLILTFFSMACFATDTESPTVKPDLTKDAPNILYVVPWTDTPAQKVKDPKLVLHNLVGDLYDPQIPSDW